MNVKCKFREKLEALLLSDFDAMTLDEFFSMAGKLFWASTVKELSLAKFFYCMKLLRRRCRQFVRGEKVLGCRCGVWPCTTTLWREWIMSASGVAPTLLSSRQNEFLFVLFVDASAAGYGAVLHTPHEIFTVGKPWESDWSFSSNEREAKAIRNGLLLHSKNLPSGSFVLVLSDNTTAVSSFVKRKSAIFRIPDNC